MAAGVFVREVADSTGMAALLRELGVGAGAGAIARSGGNGECFLIKPAWFSPHPANFVGARELDVLLGALPAGRRIVIEGYSGARNFGGRDITSENAHDNWEWIRAQDEVFRERTGIAAVLARHGAEYISVTEEVWQGRVAPASAVRAAVEAVFGGRHDKLGSEPAVAAEELFGVVPEKLFALRGSTLISYAKLKPGSWSLKNLFGLIPDPLRYRWHGEDGTRLGRSIVDIAAVYRALFRVVGLVEGMFDVPVYSDGGEVETPWGNYDVATGPGVVLAGEELVTLDVCAARVVGSEVGARSFMRVAEKVFREKAAVPDNVASVLANLAARWRVLAQRRE